MTSQYENILTSNLCFNYIKGGSVQVKNGLREWTTSPFDAVIYVIKGSFKLHRPASKTISVSDNECIFLPAHAVRQADFFSDNGNTRILNIYFNFTSLNSIHFFSLFDISNHFAGDLAAGIFRLINDLHGLEANREIPAIIKGTKTLKAGFDLLDILMQNSQLNTDKANILRRHSRLSSLLASVKANPERPITADDMAKEVHVSKSRLYQLFNQLTGLSPVAYVRIQRLEKAASMLLNEDLTIGEIADNLGYSDQFTFSKVFKNYFGLAPSLYRTKASTSIHI